MGEINHSFVLATSDDMLGEYQVSTTHIPDVSNTQMTCTVEAEIFIPKLVSVMPNMLPAQYKKCPRCKGERAESDSKDGENRKGRYGCKHDFHTFFTSGRDTHETIPLTCILCKKSVTNDETKLKKCPKCKECCDSCDDSKPWWTGDLLGPPDYHNVTQFEARREALRLMHSNPQGWVSRHQECRPAYEKRSPIWYGKRLNNYMTAVIEKDNAFEDSKWKIMVLYKFTEINHYFLLATSDDMLGEYQVSTTYIPDVSNTQMTCTVSAVEEDEVSLKREATSPGSYADLKATSPDSCRVLERLSEL